MDAALLDTDIPQTNTLFNQFQETLKEGGGLRNLIAGSSAPQPAPDPRPAQSKKPSVTDASVVDVTPVSSFKKPQSTRKKSVKKRVPQSKKSPATKKPQPTKQTPFWKRDVRDLLGIHSSR